MKAVRVWAVLVMWVAAVPPAGAQASAGDARIVAAREALRSGDGATLDQLAAILGLVGDAAAGGVVGRRHRQRDVLGLQQRGQDVVDEQIERWEPVIEAGKTAVQG